MHNHSFISLFLSLILTLSFLTCTGQPRSVNQHNLYELVNPALGTKGKGFGIQQQYLEAGFTFPGPTLPFGMVQFTTTFFDENKGFVINQMSGAGCRNMGNLPMLPLLGELTKSPNDMMNYKPNIQIIENHAGYYQARLFNQINCELTTTLRTGIARLEFNGNNKGTIIIGTGINSSEICKAHVSILSPNQFEGEADGGSFCGIKSYYKIYFVAKFNTNAIETGTWKGNVLNKGSKTEQGSNSGVFFTFNTKNKSHILYKVGISYVSIENARENLLIENKGWNFDQLKKNAETDWNQALGKIVIKGGSMNKIIQFYSNLYHAFMHPSICNDVNGQYMGADGQVHTVNFGNYYTAFSNWDTYRTQIQLLSMLFPKQTSQIVSSLITFAQQSGGGFPRWVLANCETGIMQGDPTSILIANAYAFGARQFNAQSALAIMRNGAEVPGVMSQGVKTRPFLEQYLSKGYISSPMGASILLEYTSADFAIAQFAKLAFHNEELYKIYLTRAQKWKNLYNPKTKWVQARNIDGSWKPLTEDWREASYKNYFWMVPFDLKTLTDTIGGPSEAEKRLDDFFVKLNANYQEDFFAAGNEPDFQSPWTYNWIGKPSKTQNIIRRIINEQYSNRDCGLPGNDDLGAMAAWYVFANMGIYPMIPGIAGFSLNSPSFGEIHITLGNGKKLLIKCNPEGLVYIDKLKVNGKQWKSTWLPFKEIEKGGTLLFKLTSKPTTWGSGTLPPSFNK